MLEPAAVIFERASVDNEARVKSGRDFDSSRPSIGGTYLSCSSMSVVLGAFWRQKRNEGVVMLRIHHGARPLVIYLQSR